MKPVMASNAAARLAWLLGAVALAALGWATALQAFVFPLELEFREGTVWLHVLAERAGVSIYDHTRVAFVNQNHGPLDPLLKQAVAAALPWLSSAMVTRFFVLLLPAALWLALWRGAALRPAAALAWAGGLHLLLLGLQPPHFLIGRSDPTALALLAAMIACAAGARSWPRHAATGGLGALVLLANWRCFPAVGAVALGFALESWSATARERRRGVVLATGGVLALGFATPPALVLALQFHGDLDLYHRHFFGFFSSASGWGTTAAGTFELWPAALFAGRWLLHLGALAGIALALAFPAARVPRAVQAVVWLPLLALLGLTTAVAYHLNHGGGGLHYFAPFWLLLAVHLARAIDWARVPWRPARWVWAALLIAGLPWMGVARQRAVLAASMEQAQAFLAVCRERAGGAPIYSEDFHLHRDRYHGEVIDMGDTVEAISRARYLGATFSATAERAFAALEREPPAFVLTGGCGSPALQALLARAYSPVLRVPYREPYAGPPQTLHQLKAARPAAP
jgi:hypothetical protein